jgi:prepilin-type N-terminal cleavage/methylation domain-containing protein
MFSIRRRPKPYLAFTLIELLIVIAVIGILIALLFPALNAVRTSSRATACRSNLRQLGMGVIAFAHDRDGQLPAQWRRPYPNAMQSLDHFSWAVDVLPYVDQQVVRDSLDLEKAPLDSVNRPYVSISIPIFECPATPGSPRKIAQLRTNTTTYSGINIGARDYAAIHSVYGPDSATVLPGIWNGGADLDELTYQRTEGTADSFEPQNNTFDPLVHTYRAILTRARDGLANTALLVEQAGKPDHYQRRELIAEGFLLEGPWSTGESNQFTGNGVNADNSKDPYSFHGGVSVIMADGSVHTWDESIDPRVMRSLMSRSGGEIISADDWR